MAACDACENLRGTLSDASPHPALKRIDTRKHRAYGLATGVVEFYRCSTCGTEMSRDCDPKDPGSNWGISKPRK